MAEATREFAIAKTMEILRAYVRKIEDARGYFDCLSPEGRRIVENYDNNVDGQKTLLLKASDNKDFFSGMTDEMVIAYADVCRKMNDRFDLNVKKVYPIERLAADKKGFWETVWGALQGEFNEDQTGSEILIDMGLNFIPGVGQVLDARDIAACLKKLVLDKRANEVMIWVTLLLTAVGCIPGVGDVVKAGCKAILKGADDIFIAVLKKIDAENVYRAFRKFSGWLSSCLDNAAGLVQEWIGAAVAKGKIKSGEIAERCPEMLKKAAGEIRDRLDEFGRKLKIKSLADVGKLENIVPQKYYERAHDLISNMPEKQRQEVTEYIGELYQKYGDPRKTMQEHHWIEQSRIKNTNMYPFLNCPPMKEDLLKSKSNLSLIVGHNGGHKNIYNRLLDKKLDSISKDLKLECLKRNISLNKLLQDDNIKRLVNNNVEKIITEMQDVVKKDHTIMNNVEKMFILD